MATRSPAPVTPPGPSHDFADTSPAQRKTQLAALRARLFHGVSVDGLTSTDGQEARKAAGQEAAADPKWTQRRDPWCQDCPQCQEAHYRLVDLVRCCADRWDLAPGSWHPATSIWWAIRTECPEALQATSVDAMGIRLVREGWKPRWKGRSRVYCMDDLPPVPRKR